MGTECVFCRICAGELAAHVVLEDDSVVAFLDARPLFPGHTLVVPRAHHETLLEVPAEAVEPLFAAVQHVTGAVTEALHAEGSFVAMNNRVSQSVAHLHVHVVPRRKGDGLRGFFWPRQRYADEDEMARVAALVRDALTSTPRGGPSSR